MKQTIILLTGLLLATTVLHSQEKQSRFFTELSVGPSYPVGTFAEGSKYSDVLKSKQPGLAQTGWGGNFSYGYYLNRSVGVLLSAGYSDHKQDLSNYAQAFMAPYVDPIANMYMKYSGKSWKETNVRAGAFFVLPLTANHRLNLVTKLTAGVCKTARPGYDWKLLKIDDGTVYSEGTEKKIDLPWAFCYQADVALKYKLGNHLYVFLNANYFKAMPRKEFSAAYPYYNGGERKFYINTINVLAGIGFDF